jgi:hypothetical protein
VSSPSPPSRSSSVTKAGHHLGGHDGYHISGAHAEAQSDQSEPSAPSKFTEQTLEHEADRIRLRICRITLMKLPIKLCNVRAHSDVEPSILRHPAGRGGDDGGRADQAEGDQGLDGGGDPDASSRGRQRSFLR